MSEITYAKIEFKNKKKLFLLKCEHKIKCVKIKCGADLKLWVSVIFFYIYYNYFMDIFNQPRGSLFDDEYDLTEIKKLIRRN